MCNFEVLDLHQSGALQKLYLTKKRKQDFAGGREFKTSLMLRKRQRDLHSMLENFQMLNDFFHIEDGIEKLLFKIPK